jgi:hypothetical protein
MTTEMISVSRSRLWSAALCIWVLLTGSSCLRAQDAATPTPNATDDRPLIEHQTEKVTDYGLPSDDAVAVSGKPASSGPLVAPGLHLPSTGRLWALDSFQAKQELVHAKYAQIDLNNHTGSNILKTEAAPFLYKPKKTLEIKGSSAQMRLHAASPVFFVRRISWDGDESENESQSVYDPNALSLIRLQVKPDRRIAATVAFAQLTSRPSRSDSAIEVVSEPIPGTDWYKLTTKEPLAPGEYGLMALPKRQDEFTPGIYDFAIDPTAAENAGAIAADTEK